MTTRSAWLILLVALVMLLIGSDLLLACPTCKDSLAESDPDRAGMVQGYFWSIVFMMSMPFLILGGLGTYFYLEVRKARLRGHYAEPEIATTGQQTAGA